jgi:hypothetical protein
MIRRAITRPRSSILLEVAKKTLHPSALCRACTVGQIRARNRPAVGSRELFIWALPKRRIDFPALCQADPSQRIPVPLNLPPHGRVGKASPPGPLIVDQMLHLGGAGNRDGDGRMGDHVL